MINTIEQALHHLRPGASWSINGGTLAGIEWTDAVQSRPTDAEITAVLGLPTPHIVSKVTIIRRLSAIGKFDVALAALKADALMYELWSAVPAIRSDDVQARTLFTAVGADADAILAVDA